MPELDTKPDMFVRGHPAPGAKSLNEIVQAVLRQIRGGAHVDSSYYGDRVFLDSHHINPQLPDVRNYLTQFVIVQIQTDFLICTPFYQPLDQYGQWTPQLYDPNLGQGKQPVYAVAKPYQLQQTPFAGKTVLLNQLLVSFTYTGIGMRTASSANGSEDQVIVPDYFLGDIITAYPLPAGYIDPNHQTQLAWTDMNTAARAWALKTS
jgi:hypothetical protein